ncbi:GPR1/FUN34/yaaH family-domain-containing protein [Gongronella butleri]|nr:GPR1/FUN34/yaaH family-domain-containing protein [Gongronella butleri]
MESSGTGDLESAFPLPDKRGRSTRTRHYSISNQQGEALTADQMRELGNLYATYNMMTRKLTTVVNGQNMEQPIRMGNPGVVGLWSFSVVTILLGVFRLFIPWKPTSILLPTALLFGGIAQYIAGFLDLYVGGTFSATVLISYGAFWAGNGILYFPAVKSIVDDYVNAEDLHQAQMIYDMMWALYTLMLVVLSLFIRSGTIVFTWCLFWVFLTLILAAAFDYTQNYAVLRASGVCAILAALGAFYSGITVIMEEQGRHWHVGHYPWCHKPEPKTE